MWRAVMALAMTACGRIGFDPNAPVVDAPIDPALFAWWKLDQGQGLIAFDSARDNDAAIDGAQWVQGDRGTALAFAGGSRAFVDNRPGLDVATDGLTIAFWAEVRDVPTADERLLHMESTWDVKLNGPRRLPQLSRVNPVGFASLDVTFPEGGWHHLTFTFESGTVIGYLDGVLQQFDTFMPFDSVLAPSTAGLAMGVRTDGQDPCDCAMNDVRLYARALTAQEIVELAR